MRYLSLILSLAVLLSCTRSPLKSVEGLWSNEDGSITVEFNAETMKAVVSFNDDEPFHYTTDWTYDERNGIGFGTTYGHGELMVIRPDGHLYYYNDETGTIKDMFSHMHRVKRH